MAARTWARRYLLLAAVHALAKLLCGLALRARAMWRLRALPAIRAPCAAYTILKTHTALGLTSGKTSVFSVFSLGV